MLPKYTNISSNIYVGVVVWAAGLSSVSSGSSNSGGSYRSGIREGKLTRPVTLYSNKRLTQAKKVRYTVSLLPS